MRVFRDTYFGLSREKQMLVLFALLLIVSVIAYFLVIAPAVNSYKQKKSTYSMKEGEIRMLELQLEKLKTLGQLNRPVEAAQITELNKNDNGILFATEVPVFLKELRQLCEKVGGDNFNLIEGEIETAFLSVGPRNDVFKVNRLPLTVMFESNYSISSNYLFQLRAMKKMMVFEEIDVRSPDLSGEVQATIDMNLYFIEEI
ncbi:MAG TPA: hypothetical protein PLN69_04865 [bacterium]|nr:hypothetical protein [bacterium]